jgi:hypothetical protein
MTRCQIGPKDCFVIFVLVVDEFEQFGQAFGDINISLIVSMMGVKIQSSEIAHQTTTFDSNLPTAFYFTVLEVFLTSAVQKPFIPVKVLCENVK